MISGVAQGALYALVALAMTVIYRATTVINFGHGDLVMAGAFVVYLLVVLGGAPFLVSALLAVVLLFAFGVAVYKGLIRPIVAGPHLALAMMAVVCGRRSRQREVGPATTMESRRPLSGSGSATPARSGMNSEKLW